MQARQRQSNRLALYENADFDLPKFRNAVQFDLLFPYLQDLANQA